MPIVTELLEGRRVRKYIFIKKYSLACRLQIFFVRSSLFVIQGVPWRSRCFPNQYIFYSLLFALPPIFLPPPSRFQTYCDLNCKSFVKRPMCFYSSIQIHFLTRNTVDAFMLVFYCIKFVKGVFFILLADCQRERGQVSKF